MKKIYQRNKIGLLKLETELKKEDCFNILEKSKIQDKEDLLKALNKLLINEGKKKKKDSR